MKLVDYRDMLGINLNSKQLFQNVQIKLINYLNHSDDIPEYSEDSLFDFCMAMGLPFSEYEDAYEFEPISDILETNCSNIKELVICFISFIHTFDTTEDEKLKLVKTLQKYLSESNNEYEIYQDQDGYYLFPIGAEILDKNLVSEPLLWLDDYPQTKKIFSIALKQYSEKVFIRDTADNFRKALEDFFKEFLQNSKNLENNIPLIGAYLKENGASEEIAKILVGLVNLYSTLNNKIAKHHDNVDSKFLEFLMYQTGLFIRMLIIVKRESS